MVSLFSSRSSVVFLAYSRVILTAVDNTADDHTVPHLYLQVIERCQWDPRAREPMIKLNSQVKLRNSHLPFLKNIRRDHFRIT